MGSGIAFWLDRYLVVQSLNTQAHGSPLLELPVASRMIAVDARHNWT
jgi:hypothetical protein